jgi:uncharacterized protein (TIGR02145 family)
MKNILRISGAILLISVLLIHSCKKEIVPTLTTSAITNITEISAICGGNIIDEGSDTIITRGVCWSNGITPTISNSKTMDGAGVGSFTSNISGLNGSTTYYVRAYATNSAGIGYGMTMAFTTQQGSGGTITDIDGNVYHTVTIGTQTWMKENLKVTHYCNGDLIGTTTLNISSESAPKYQWAYEGNEGTVATYDRLYTWYAVTDSRNVCPISWHIPTDAEWTVLTEYLGGNSVAGGKLKETGITHWQSPNIGATNESDFTALPGGYRFIDGTFSNINSWGFWWSATIGINANLEAWGWFLVYEASTVGKGSDGKNVGFSVRCVRDY